ncbi:ATP-binding protein [Sphaerisporangium sp. NPDC005288]|uniref:ATP-binding protein n=1 Tax=Sphaerisporangium sp. NPDC005288 TaxID=3155114 RepID=UPI0033B72E36
MTMDQAGAVEGHVAVGELIGAPGGWSLVPNPPVAGEALRVRSVRRETFRATGDQVSCARRVTEETLLDHPAAEIAVLLVSELSSNSVRYSGSSFFTLAIVRTFAEDLHIKVMDEGNNGLPRLLRDDQGAESGRGMRLVDVLAKQWGITRRRGDGMAVWFDVDEKLPETWVDLLLVGES